MARVPLNIQGETPYMGLGPSATEGNGVGVEYTVVEEDRESMGLTLTPPSSTEQSVNHNQVLPVRKRVRETEGGGWGVQPEHEMGWGKQPTNVVNEVCHLSMGRVDHREKARESWRNSRGMANVGGNQRGSLASQAQIHFGKRGRFMVSHGATPRVF